MAGAVERARLTATRIAKRPVLVPGVFRYGELMRIKEECTRDRAG